MTGGYAIFKNHFLIRNVYCSVDVKYTSVLGNCLACPVPTKVFGPDNRVQVLSVQARIEMWSWNTCLFYTSWITPHFDVLLGKFAISALDTFGPAAVSECFQLLHALRGERYCSTRDNALLVQKDGCKHRNISDEYLVICYFAADRRLHT